MGKNRIMMPAVVTSYRKLNDRSINVTVNSGLEVSTEQLIAIDRMYQKEVFFLVQDAELDEADVEMMDNVEIDIFHTSKTPSQRLRAVLFKVHQLQIQDEDFKEYYRRQMEKIINHYKSKLDL